MKYTKEQLQAALYEMPECPISYVGIRGAVGKDGEVIHLECRCKDGQKYAPVVIDNDREDIARYLEWVINNDAKIRAALTAQPAESVEGLGEINKEFGKVRNALDDMLERTDGIHALEKIAIFCNTVIRPILSQPKQPDVSELLERAKALVKYCEWQINEGTDHHPTLPSAIVSAKEAIANAEQKGQSHE